MSSGHAGAFDSGLDGGGAKLGAGTSASALQAPMGVRAKEG
jgi:hypothetical protein